METKERQLPTKQAVHFLLHKNGKFLFETPTLKSDSFYGMLKVPAGKINDGEIDAEAVVREFQEELGASPVDIVFLDSLVNTTPSGDTYLIHSYLVLDVEGNVVNKEPKKTKHEWLTFNEAERRLELVDSILTLKLARDYLSEARRNKD